MITQQNLRSILPGKILRAVMIIAARDKKPTLQSLKDFYLSPVYVRLEQVDEPRPVGAVFLIPLA